MDNQVHIEIKEKLEAILQKVDYTQANIYELLKEAIECQMPYDTSLNTSRKFNIPFELIQLYFLHTPLKDFKEQKDFYVKNKEQASFIALLFLADKEKVTQFKAIEKAKLLIDWGYNIEARLDKPHFNQFVYFDYSEVGLSLLHYATSKPLIEYLIEKGANLYAQAQCAYQYSIKLLVDSGITQIKNQKHWESFLFYEKQVSYKMGKNELTISDLKKQYKQPNRYLNL